MKTGIEIPEDEVTFYDYKEPLRKVKRGNGFGYLGVLSYSKDKDRVQCHACGKFYKAIRASHLKTHGMTTDEYREKYQLAKTSKLVGEGTREKMLQNSRKSGGFKKIKALQTNKEWREKQRQRLIESNKKRKGKKERLELKNKKGTCPDQLLEKIRDLRKELGHTPSKKEFQRKYKGRYLGIIYITFGSWTKAVKRAGYKPQSEIRKEKYSVDNLKKYLADFYVQHGRTPSSSDMQRGLLPDTHTYLRRFPSINHARVEAGVPMLVQIGYNRYAPYTPTETEIEQYLLESKEFRKAQEWSK